FIEGYFDCNAGIGVKDGLHVVTESKQFALDVTYLLNRLGVIAFMTKKKRKSPNGIDRQRIYYRVSVHGDDLVTLSRWIKFRCEHKQKQLMSFVRYHLNSERPSNCGTISLDRNASRRARVESRLTMDAMGNSSTVNNLENEHVVSTRCVATHLVQQLKLAGANDGFTDELRWMRMLIHPDIAWDCVTEIWCEEAQDEYFYDITMLDTPTFIGNGIVLHNTHVFTTTTGAMKNAFGGLLRENRHWCHAHIHETLVDLLVIQKEIHPGLFAVMDGTFAGNGAGPRAMEPVVANLILASDDMVAIDAIAAKIMGFDPLSLDYIRLAHERGLGCGDPREIEIVGDDISNINLHFRVTDTFASRGQKAIYWGPLKPLEHVLLRSPIVPWSYMASRFYYDLYWYQFIGRKRVREMLKTQWGQLFLRYGA
ncbi:MAG TPA: DUF362 domain-containing protein, partial [Armatimonadetes bacterium]|nr:DUF362 domain-containing protein [Armatimonadota bacterium]